MLDSIGELVLGGTPFGCYCFVERDELRTHFFAAGDLTQAIKCPSVGDVVGGLAWTFWTSIWDTRSFFSEHLLEAGLGSIATTSGSHRFDYIVENDFQLFEATKGGGFVDGDFFIRGDPSYDAYVRKTIGVELSCLGLEADWCSGTTHHNPHQINQLHSHRGESLKQSWERFRAHGKQTVRLTGKNTEGVLSSEYRELLEVDR